MKTCFFSGLLACLLVLCSALGAFAQKYTVYCTHGKTEVDTRDPKQMEAARGSNTYPMAVFDYRLDADRFVRQMKGICPKK